MFPDLGDALTPSQKASRTTWVNGLPTIPTAANLTAESISPTTGPGREGKKDTVVSLEHVCAHSVCNEVRCRPYPAILPSPFHHCLTPAHTGKRLPQLLCPMQPRYIGRKAPHTASAVGDRSLTWPYHITGTPGCSTPKVDNQHSQSR